MKLNTVSIAHQFLAAHVRPGDFCIDATAGRGYDTAYLCTLVGEQGKVLAFDIQPEALETTRQRLQGEQLADRARLILDSHANLAEYAAPESVAAITFNFGYLPGGDHHISTQPESSIAAIRAGLTLLRDGGVMSLCIYYGGDTGFAERDALLAYLRTIDSKQYTVLLTDFCNRPNCPPMAAFLWKSV